MDDVLNDLDGDSDIDNDDLQIYLDTQCTYYDDEWILNIADLVVSEQDITNDGGKLFKIRFYPVATTEFIPAE